MTSMWLKKKKATEKNSGLNIKKEPQTLRKTDHLNAYFPTYMKSYGRLLAQWDRTDTMNSPFLSPPGCIPSSFLHALYHECLGMLLKHSVVHSCHFTMTSSAEDWIQDPFPLFIFSHWTDLMIQLKMHPWQAWWLQTMKRRYSNIFNPHGLPHFFFYVFKKKNSLIPH